MVIWYGVLKVKPGQREEYIKRLRKEDFIKKFKEHPGNKFYTIGALIEDEDVVIVCDGWEDRVAFEAHDKSKDVDVWREVYSQYVIDCKSELFEL